MIAPDGMDTETEPFTSLCPTSIQHLLLWQTHIGSRAVGKGSGNKCIAAYSAWPGLLPSWGRPSTQQASVFQGSCLVCTKLEPKQSVVLSELVLLLKTRA